MKKAVLILLVFAVVTGSALAQGFDILSFPAPVQEGAIMLDLGLGMRALGLTGHTMSIPPLFIQGEFALPVGVPISVGAGFAFGQWKWSFFGLGYKVMYFTPHLRGNWHWGFNIPWLDLYTGMSLGWDVASVKWDGLTGSADARSRFFWGLQVGAHFYFSKNVGAMVESGYPYWIKAGLALKFGGTPAPRRSSSSSSSSSRSSGDYMLVDVDALNVRSGPGADHTGVGIVERNNRVEVLERSGQWWKIKYGNIEGYVNSSYLKEDSQR